MQSRTRVAGVLATAVTLRSARFRALLERHAADLRVLCQPGHGLVEAVECGDVGSPELLALLRGYLKPMLDAGADTLVLGCTHYPFLDTAIRSIIGERMTLVDTGVAIARQLERVLTQHGLLADATGGAQGSARFCSTSDGAHLRTLAAALLGIDAHVECVQIPSPRTLELETDVA